MPRPVMAECFFCSRVLLLAISGAVLALPLPAGESNSPSGAEQEESTAISPVAQLVRDPGVQAELKLRPDQLASIDAEYAKLAPKLWTVRDATQGPAAIERARLTRQFAKTVEGWLDSAQSQRLRQLVVQSLGWRSLTLPSIAAELNLTDKQARQIDEVVADTADKLRQNANAGDSQARRDKNAAGLRHAEGAAVQKLLGAKQRKQVAELVGEPYDLSQVRPLVFPAPALGQVDRWINSSPLGPEDVRGKVVAFHFWAVGCINGQRNLPHYHSWHEQFGRRGLIVWGMHTPETKAERELSALAQKVNEQRIAYPVSADHDNANWNAWSNFLWPSVYLVDKRGTVRYWWYGELNWQGAEGEKFMRQKIEELLAEAE